jgi:hypothetical protein
VISSSSSTTGVRTTGTTGTTGVHTTSTGTTGVHAGTTGTTGVHTTGTGTTDTGTTGVHSTSTTGTSGSVSTTGSITAGSPGGNWCYQETATTAACNGGSGSIVFSPNLVTFTYIKPSNAIQGTMWQVKHGSLAAYNVTIPGGCWGWSSTILLLQFYSRSDSGCTSGSFGSCFDGTSWQNLTMSTSGSCGTSSGSTNTGNTVVDGDWNTYGYYVGDIGTAWTYTGANPSDTSGQARIYEEAIWWSISNIPGGAEDPQANNGGASDSNTETIGDNQVGNTPSDSHSNTGAITGGVIAAVAAVGAIGATVYLIRKKRTSRGNGTSI